MAKQTQKQKNPNSSKKKKITIGVICGLLGAGAIAAGLAVGLTQCSKPSTQPIVTFSTGGDKDVIIDGPTTVELEPGQTFGDAKKEVTIIKIVDNVEWTFVCWVSKKEFDPEKEIPKVEDNTVITGPTTVYPYFIEPKEEYIEKTVDWENLGTVDTPKPADKEFILSESEKSINISNFVMYRKGTNDLVQLQEGETVTAEAKPIEGETRKFTIDAECIESETTRGKINILFTINKDSAITEDLYDSPIKFNVTITLHHKGTSYEQAPIQGLQITLTRPWTFPVIDYVCKEGKITTFETLSGVKSYKLDSKTNGDEDKNNYFVIDRPLVDDETLNVACIDPTSGKPIDGLEVTHLVQKSEDGTKAFVDLNFVLTKINSYFQDEEKKFKLKFWITFNSTGRDSDPYILPDEFTIKYNKCTTPPYCLATDQVYINEKGSSALAMSVDISNREFDYFKEGDYLKIINITRGEGTHSKTNPIWFSTPQEKNHPAHYGDQDDYIPLQGNNQKGQSLEVYFDFGEEGVPKPTEITTYPTEINVQFWRGIPEEAGSEKLDDYNQTIDFTYVPPGNLTGSYNQWMQYRSLGLVASAVDKKTSKTDYALGTGWILSKNPRSKSEVGSDHAYYVATSWDFREKVQSLIDDADGKYDSHSKSFGLVTPLSAKQYVSGDKTEYALLEPTNADLPNDDVIDLSLRSDMMPIRWVDPGELVWPTKHTPIWPFEDYYDASNIAIAEIAVDFAVGEPHNGNLVSRYLLPQLEILAEWARREGLTDGQRTKVFEDMPDQFKQRNYARAVTAGFDTKEITLTVDGKQKTVPAFYWRSYEMPIGGNQINYIPKIINASVRPDFGYYDVGKDKDILVCHDCGAFAFGWDSFPIANYFSESGTGAMFVLVPNGDNPGTFGTPEVAGINWNGRSLLNLGGDTITPYFDLLQIDGYSVLEGPKDGSRPNYLKPGDY